MLKPFLSNLPATPSVVGCRLSRISPRIVLKDRDLPGDELGIVLDPADQRRAPGVLPGQTKEVEAGGVGDASTVSEPPVRVEDGEVDPGVIGPVPGCPDDGVDLQLAPVLEAHGPALDADNAGFQLHAVPSPELPRARADQRVSSPQLPTEPRFDRRVEETAVRQPPEEISAEQSLRERRLPRADGEDNPARARELLRDLEARVAAADDEHRACGHVRGFAIARAVRLEDVRLESARHFRDERFLERAGGDNHLLGDDPPAVDLQHEPPVLSSEPPHRAVQLDRQFERVRVLLQICDHLVAVGVAVWIAGERKAG